MDSYEIEEDRFRNKMLMDNNMGMTFLSGAADERSRIFNKLRELNTLNDFKNGEELISEYLLPRPSKTKRSAG